MTTLSQLEVLRRQYQPKMPVVLTNGRSLVFNKSEATTAAGNIDEIKALFPNTFGRPVISITNGDGPRATAEAPLNVGVILSGGQAPGGHNVIAGLFDGIKALHPESRLYGFLLGPAGLVDHKYKELTADIISQYRNTGGFDIIGSGRTKLETKEQFDKGLEILRTLGIRALVIIGGDDSNTNACVLAEYYESIKAGVQVIGCPKTIDGDLKNSQIEISFGFDTATKVYSELIGNIARDCLSAKKYWHFIKLMGRDASHIALECALKTHPNIALISEEVKQKQLPLESVVDDIVRVIIERANVGKNYGIIIIPEGLVAFFPNLSVVISELNEIMAKEEVVAAMNELPKSERTAFIGGKLSEENAKIYKDLPESVALQMISERDPHGNVLVSVIETEKLLAEMVEKRLDKLKKEGTYKGKFSCNKHFFGYEGRACQPSNYDADYCYSLGYTASLLIHSGATGYMAAIHNARLPAAEWAPGGTPITMMMNVERRHGANKPVIKKALVDLDGRPFQYFTKRRRSWETTDDYCFPGPIQFFGPPEVADMSTITLQLEQNGDAESFARSA